MKIDAKGFSKVAFIDPKKSFGDKGQYIAHMSKTKNLSSLIKAAKRKVFEIRYDYSLGGDTTPYRFIITEIPPGHVQPFHAHKNLCEMTIVVEGEVYYIESKSLTESDTPALLKRQGVKMVQGSRVIDDSQQRHTIANFGRKYARVITIQSDLKYQKKFTADWIR